MPDFNRVKPFRFWCQKVLPLVYDDSLSYYELLNKVVDYLNKTIEDVNSVIQLTEDFTEEQAAAYAEFTAGINQTVEELTSAFNTLHDFVDNYFDNLDVQDEIDNKLDEMVIDGTLYNMFAPIAEDAVPSLVTQWLNEHITPTSPPVDKTLTVSNAAADAKVVGTNFDDLKQRMSLEEEWEIPITFEDLIQGGYNSDGSVNADGTNYLRTPQMIPIYPGMSMHFKGGAVIDRMKAGYFDPVTRRYDASKDIAWFTGERTVTFDMYGLIIPLFRRASNTEVIPTDFDAEFELISETKTRIETRVLYKNSGETANGDIDSDTGLECGYSIQPRKNLVITFSGKIPNGSTFTNLEIGLKSGSTKYNNLVIDSQNVTFTTMVNTVVTKPHGLTITKNIQVSIKTILENKAIVRITSNGSSVDLEFTPYQQWRIASAYAETSGSLTLCTLSCINQDIAKPIWFFGDSYTAYASNRWPYYADKWVNNILLDGYGGETSNYVITAFETYLTSGYPQYAVFATGMNDGSDTDVNTPNADWLSAVEEFIEICEDNQIIPILCTVPTTPVYNNNGKNVYVRTSGYWYIDFAKAVGADGTGAWYAGMLGTDNIHPTVAGAKALCAQIEADFPEVFIQGVETDKSLSRYGVAADAGECGERFDGVDAKISGLKEDFSHTESDLEQARTDITRIDDAVTEEVLRATATESLKVNKPIENPNGTNGQLLRTKGDGTTEWVDYGLPTDEQTAEAVEAWLDEHPEATTTVQDGAITMPKLNASLQDVVVVRDESEKAGFHDVAPVSVSFYSDDKLSSVSAKYASTKNIFADLFSFQTTSGITRRKSGNLVSLTGTGTSQLIINKTIPSSVVDLIKGKTFHAYLYIKKATPWVRSSWFGFYDGKSYKGRKYYSADSDTLIGWTDIGDITFANDATTFLAKFDNLTGETFVDGDCVWVGLYESALIDTEHVVSGDEPYTISVSSMPCIDTATHESTIEYVVPTKEYVDAHTPDIIGYWTNNVYALPENFGAVGDGVTDDGQAIADCIAYAITSGKEVKGYGKYKVTSPIVLNGRYLNVYLKEIVYSGSSYAVDIQEPDIVFRFQRITSSGVGIRFGINQISNRTASRCQVFGNAIQSTSHCITTEERTYYNTCEIRYLSSANGNCIDGNGGGEYVFSSSSCHCPNGYAIASLGASKFYNFTIEKDCKYGILNLCGCLCVGFRHREQTDGMAIRILNNDQTFNNGPLITFTKSVNSSSVGFRYISNDAIQWASIDLSSIQGYEPIDMQGDNPIKEWHEMMYTGVELGSSICGLGTANYRYDVIGEKLFFIGNNKVFVPSARKKVLIDIAEINFADMDSESDSDIVASDKLSWYYGTDYVVNVSHSDVYFNASFGAIGYNDLSFAQENGNTVTVYDKLGNIIFDGTNEGDGVWSLKCIMNHASNGRYGATTNRWCYDGTNEIWEVTKIE